MKASQRKAMFAKKYNTFGSQQKAKIIRDANQSREFEQARNDDRSTIHVDVESPLVMSLKHKSFKDLPKFQQKLIIREHTSHTGKVLTIPERHNK